MRNRLKKSASVCRGLLVAGCNIEPVSKPNQDLTQPGPNVFFLLRTTCQNNTEHLYFYIILSFLSGHKIFKTYQHIDRIQLSMISSQRNPQLRLVLGLRRDSQGKTGKVQGQI